VVEVFTKPGIDSEWCKDHEMVKHSITEQGKKENNNSEGEENEKPKAISMAEDLKNNNKPPLQWKAKLGDGSHIAAEDR
jgi:hypothetical protein